MAFKKGQSGNLKGRPKDAGVNAIRTAILARSDELLAVVLDQAIMDKDASLALSLLNKVLPNPKPVSEPVTFDLDVNAGMGSIGEQILIQVSEGKLPLDSGVALLGAIGTAGKLREVDEMAKEITEIEGALGDKLKK